MPSALPDDLATVLDGPNFAHLTTLDEDGWPHTTAMWVTRDGDHVVFNTIEGRRKERNLRNDPRVAFSISPVDRPYENWAVQGRVVDMRTSDGVEVIDRLSEEYTGNARFAGHAPDRIRVTIVVEVTRVASN
ncbi:MAG: TIGR03618 family F420-dependent PPOX class oxidoreductase [Acidimicrobiia bacterium]|nr:TIGR03618 family F420-dependent PPOX class oxidoreductase [Acidimicrobiia bacterium]